MIVFRKFRSIFRAFAKFMALPAMEKKTKKSPLTGVSGQPGNPASYAPETTTLDISGHSQPSRAKYPSRERSGHANFYMGVAWVAVEAPAFCCMWCTDTIPVKEKFIKQRDEKFLRRNQKKKKLQFLL